MSAAGSPTAVVRPSFEHRDAIADRADLFEAVRDVDHRDALRGESRTTAKRFLTSSLSRTAEGSSMMISLMSCDSARAMLTICLLAALSEPTSVCGERLECPSRRSSSVVCLAAAERLVNPPRAISWPRKMFSAMVRPSTTSSSWYIVAIPRSMAACGSAISTPSPCQLISPPSGRCTPASVLMSVDLPAPFWPSTQCTSPARTSRSTPRSAWTPEKDFVTPRTASNGGSWSTLITRRP